MPTKIFISYAHKDDATVAKVAKKLIKLGFEAWKDDRNLQGGELWSAEIAEGISRCDYYLLFISSAAMKSDAVRREVDLAYHQKRAMLLIRLDDTPIPPEMAFQLTGIQWIDARTADWFARLLVSLGNRSKTSALPPVSGHPAQSTPGPGSTPEKTASQDPRSGGVYFAGQAVIKGDVVGGNQTKTEK